MRRVTVAGILVVSVAIAMSNISYAVPLTSGMEAKTPYPKSQVELKMKMRKLWEDYLTWMHAYVISALENLDDAEYAAKRLLKNQEEQSEIIRLYYGDEVGDRLSHLLKEHVSQAMEIVKATRMGATIDAAEAQDRWRRNADEIAVLLSEVNPDYWSKATLIDILYKHLEYITEEIASRFNKDWGADIDSYDQDHLHILKFADMLGEGIIQQFPEKFKK